MNPSHSQKENQPHIGYGCLTFLISLIILYYLGQFLHTVDLSSAFEKAVLVFVVMFLMLSFIIFSSHGFSSRKSERSQKKPAFTSKTIVPGSGRSASLPKRPHLHPMKTRQNKPAGTDVKNTASRLDKPRILPVKTAQDNKPMTEPVLAPEKSINDAVLFPDLSDEFCYLHTYNVLDFKTANRNPDSIFQIGITIVENNRIIKTESFLIRPPYNDIQNKDIPGICMNDIKSSPTFAELWPSLTPYIENKIIAVYNAKSALGCLEAALQKFSLSSPDYGFFDILANAREHWQNAGLPNFSLTTIAQKLSLTYHAHDVKSNCLTAAKIQMECSYAHPINRIMFKSKVPDYAIQYFPRIINADTLLSMANKLRDSTQSKNIYDYELAIDYYQQAISNAPRQANIWKEYGLLLEKCSLKKEALEKFEKAASLAALH